MESNKSKKTETWISTKCSTFLIIYTVIQNLIKNINVTHCKSFLTTFKKLTFCMKILRIQVKPIVVVYQIYMPLYKASLSLSFSIDMVLCWVIVRDVHDMIHKFSYRVFFFFCCVGIVYLLVALL